MNVPARVANILVINQANIRYHRTGTSSNSMPPQTLCQGVSAAVSQQKSTAAARAHPDFWNQVLIHGGGAAALALALASRNSLASPKTASISRLASATFASDSWNRSTSSCGAPPSPSAARMVCAAPIA